MSDKNINKDKDGPPKAERDRLDKRSDEGCYPPFVRGPSDQKGGCGYDASPGAEKAPPTPRPPEKSGPPTPPAKGEKEARC